MQVMRTANWWLPRWLDRLLPDVHLEAEDVHPEPVPEIVKAG
jgi:RND superfamily putative drug exporter